MRTDHDRDRLLDVLLPSTDLRSLFSHEAEFRSFVQGLVQTLPTVVRWAAHEARERNTRFDEAVRVAMLDAMQLPIDPKLFRGEEKDK